MSGAVTRSDETPLTAKRPRLETLSTRQRTTGEQALRRSLLVKRLRVALPVLAAVLLVGLALNTRSTGVDEAFLEDFADLQGTPDEYRMANPKFAGVDDQGHPYEITAEAALQAQGDRDVVELVKPRAVTRGQDESTVVSAEKGVFQSDANVLDLSEQVTLNHSIGGDEYVLRTPAATVAIGAETVQSFSGVEGEGEAGTLRADRMRAYNGEGRVVFEGNVSMRIFPKRAKLPAATEKGSGESSDESD
jgi:lipopolysaccharide export system protein LptC